MNIAVMASTKGTALQAIIDAIKDGKLRNTDIKVVISNKDCHAIKRAEKEGIKTRIIKPWKDEKREDYDKRITTILNTERVELIVLVGYMRLFSPWFVKRYENRIMNIHPSLLPSFPGMDLDVHKAVLDYGCKISGCTIHFVDEGKDTGPIIMQECVKVEKDDTPESLKEKVQAVEKRLYPDAIQLFVDGKIKLAERKIII